MSTAIGNLVKGDHPQIAVKKAIEKVMSIEGVKGAMIIYRDRVGFWGRISKMISVK